MSDTVKRLKMAYQKQTMIHQNHGLTKFPYKVNNNSSKISNNNSLMIKSKTGESSEQKIVKSSLKSMRTQDASRKSELNLFGRLSDAELYKDLNNEYNRLKDEISNMSIGPKATDESSD